MLIFIRLLSYFSMTNTHRCFPEYAIFLSIQKVKQKNLQQLRVDPDFNLYKNLSKISNKKYFKHVSSKII